MTREEVVEPTLGLPSGRRVLACIADLVASLQASGHRIILRDDDVIVSPDVHPDTRYLLTSNRQDVQAILEDRAVWDDLERAVVTALTSLVRASSARRSRHQK